MRRLFWALVVLGLLAGGVFYVLTAPATIEASALPKHTADLKNGEYMFYAGGCASCHATPASDNCEDPKTPDELKLGGGRCLITPFGTFYVPNISPHKTAGIGGWSDLDFVNAMMRGVSPGGAHYYPAFPYTSYQRMRYEDVLDLKAFIDTLSPEMSSVPGHDLALPFRLRRGLGLWKQLFMDNAQFVADPSRSPKLNRGAYLVEGPGHCGECHSPRNLFGGIVEAAKYSGGPAPEGKGFIPNITPHKTGIASWSEEDIAYSLESGFTPSFDVFGGTMTKVQENMAKLTGADRSAIAAYLKALPPIANAAPKKTGDAAK